MTKLTCVSLWNIWTLSEEEILNTTNLDVDYIWKEIFIIFIRPDI